MVFVFAIGRNVPPKLSLNTTMRTITSIEKITLFHSSERSINRFGERRLPMNGTMLYRKGLHRKAFDLINVIDRTSQIQKTCIYP